MERITAQFISLAEALAPPAEEVATIEEVFVTVQRLVSSMFPQGKVR